ncbi:hypothetical protein AB1Y20_002698 [Prymnesium parvum]|uniref:Phospholipid scramblase n=1 Tax=Prymnesium parvum TaxID=97485 RepID=A0AB34J9T3_PRYPA
MPEYLFNAVICGYNSLKTDKFPMGYTQKAELLCIDCEVCFGCSNNCNNGPKLIEPYQIYVKKSTDGCCELGGFCFKTAIKKPRTFLESNEELFCYRQAASLPFTQFGAVRSPLCAVCFVRLYPAPIKVGDPPPLAAPSFMSILR